MIGLFFHGWRRKLGLVTLVLACVFMAGWLRSFSTQDTLTMGFGSSVQLNLVSNSGRLIAATVTIEGKQPIRMIPWNSQRITADGWELGFHLPDQLYASWMHSNSDDLYSAGTDQMGAHHFQFVIKWCQFPYWLVVLPLTLLSAWLLLCKPRIAKAAPK